MPSFLRLLCLFASGIIAGGVVAQTPTGAKEMFDDGAGAIITTSQAANNTDNTKTKSGKRKTTESKKKVSSVKHPRPAFGLRCAIELIEGSTGKGREVDPAWPFRSGDRIRLRFRGNAAGRISIMQLGASGSASMLFPDAAKGLTHNAIRAGVDHVLPSEDHWFRFDSTPGTERLLVVFAKDQPALDRALEVATPRLVAEAGSKDLVIENVPKEAMYVVNRTGDLVVMELRLTHQ